MRHDSWWKLRQYGCLQQSFVCAKKVSLFFGIQLHIKSFPLHLLDAWLDSGQSISCISWGAYQQPANRAKYIFPLSPRQRNFSSFLFSCASGKPGGWGCTFATPCMVVPALTKCIINCVKNCDRWTKWCYYKENNRKGSTLNSGILEWKYSEMKISCEIAHLVEQAANQESVDLLQWLQVQ